MKILHCADVHIGMEFTANRMRSRQRKAEILNGFLRVLSFCKEKCVDVLLIAGDLFDNENIEPEVLEQIRAGFADIEGTDVYIAPGNHDALTPSSPYRKVEWPKNVMIFDGEGKIIEHEDKGYRIWGCGFEHAFVSNRLLSGIRLKRDELINIGIIHGQLVGKNGTAIYNPITDADIEKSNMDYLALGHIHKQTDILKNGNTLYAYSGTIEGQGFDEDGIKGFYYGELTREQLNEGKHGLEYISFAARRYTLLEVNISEAESKSDIMRLIMEAVETSDSEHFEDDLYKIKLTGDISQDMIINSEDIKADLASKLYFVKVKDKTELLIDYEELAKENSLKGMFAATMLNSIKECEEKEDTDGVKKNKKALELGIRAFMGEVSVNED